MNKKGQAAMEFLMTYGWAILVVLAAIGALAYFGVLSPDKFLADKYVVSGGFSAGSYKVSSAGTVFLEVQNNLGVDAAQVNITLTPRTTGVTTCGTAVALGPMGNSDTNSTTFTCTGLTGAITKFRGDITLVYQKSGEPVTHSASGSITGKVE